MIKKQINLTLNEDKSFNVKRFTLGNKYENGVSKITFSIPSVFSDLTYRYICFQNEDETRAFLLPLNSKNEYIVSTIVTKESGNWNVVLMLTKSEIINVENIFEIEDEVLVSDMIIGIVGDNYINDEVVEDPEQEPSLRPFYEDLNEQIQYLNSDEFANIIAQKIGGSSESGATFIPSVSEEGIISWTNNKELPNPEPVNIKGPKGEDGVIGKDGTTFTPSVSEEGIISWSNDGEKENPNPVNIKGPKGDNGKDGKNGKDGEDPFVISQEEPEDKTKLWIVEDESVDNAVYSNMMIKAQFVTEIPATQEQGTMYFLINGQEISTIIMNGLKIKGDVPTPPAPEQGGLYGANGGVIATWEELLNLGLDIEKDYSGYPSSTDKMLANIAKDNPYLKESTKLVVPSSVNRIGNYALSRFEGYLDVTEVQLSNEIQELGLSIFYHSPITSVNIPNKLTVINRAFSGCSSLTNIVIPSSVTSIGDNEFGFCSSLTNIVIPESVTSIGNEAFIDCTSLNEINIPSSVTSIGNNTFNGCSSLTNIVIPSSVTSIGDSTFSGCSSLTSIVIPSSVTSIGDMAFILCTSLTEINIPSSVTSIGDNTFNGCDKLVTIHYSGTATGAPWGATNATVVSNN